MPPRKWIVFEGPNGSGKTTQAKRLKKELCQLGIRAQYEHVFDTPLGLELRRVFLETPGISTNIELLILFASRLSYVEARSNVRADVLITDRFLMSIQAIQGSSPATSKALVTSMSEIFADLPKPDLTICLDVPPEVGLARIPIQEWDKIEKLSLERHHRIREMFLALAHTEDCFILDGSQPVEDVSRGVTSLALRIIQAHDTILQYDE